MGRWIPTSTSLARLPSRCRQAFRRERCGLARRRDRLLRVLLALPTAHGAGLDRGHRAEGTDRPAGAAPQVGALAVPGHRYADPRGVGSIEGSGVAVAFGLALALWAGLGGVRATQVAMDTVWDVPRKRRPGMPVSDRRASLMLVILGAFVVGAAVLSGAAAGASGAWKRPEPAGFGRAQRRDVRRGLPAAHIGEPGLARRAPRGRPGGGGMDRAARRRGVDHRGADRVGIQRLRHVRTRHRSARLDLPRCPDHTRGRGAQRRALPAPLAPVATGERCHRGRRTGLAPFGKAGRTKG